MQNTKRIWVWVGIAVVVIAIGVVAFEKLVPGSPSVAHQSAPVVVYAPKGHITSQFPQQLILDISTTPNVDYIGYSSTTRVASSYASSSSGGAEYNTVFDSSSTAQSMYQSYLEYLFAHGWNITNSVSKSRTSQIIEANNSSSAVMVTVIPLGKASEVSITYSVK